MIQLRTFTDVNLRSEPSSAQGAATIVRVLPEGTLVEQTGRAPGHPDWVAVRHEGTDGFVKRMLLAQDAPGALASVRPPLLAAFSDTLWATTAAFEHVAYELGAKDPTRGTVDCSGWIAFANRRAFNAVNAAAGRTVFATAVLSRLNTHSDHQVSLTGYAVEQIFSGEAFTRITWRPGILIGINFSDYGWERGQDRVFEIDHIVQTVADPSGRLYVTQSSSGGGGVNVVKLDGWLSNVGALVEANRVHAVDIFAAATNAGGEEAVAPDAAEAYRELPELDTSRTPAG